MAFELNKRIAIKEGEFNGVVRYIGKVEGKSGEWVGIELDSPKGSNDGSYNGIQYFSCPPRCGVFIKTNRLIHEGGNEISDSYAIKERQPAPEFPKNHNCFDYSDLTVTQPRSTNNSDQHPVKEGLAEKEAPSFYSLFTQALATNNNHDMKGNTGLEPSIVDFEAENRILKEELFKYQQLLSTVFNVCKSGLVKVSSELQDIQSRLARIGRPVIKQGEKEIVASIVGELYKEYRKGNKERAGVLYNKFKSITNKYRLPSKQENV